MVAGVCGWPAEAVGGRGAAPGTGPPIPIGRETAWTETMVDEPAECLLSSWMGEEDMAGYGRGIEAQGTRLGMGK